MIILQTTCLQKTLMFWKHARANFARPDMLVWLLALALLRCGNASEILLDVPEGARADSATPIALTARVKFRGLAVADNTDVRFKASIGSFAADKALGEASSRTSGGAAKIDYYPPSTPQDVTLTVSFTNANRGVFSIDRVIALTGLPPADASQIAFGCEAENVGALVPGLPRVEIACTVQARDAAGNGLPGAEMVFAAEAGSLRDGGVQMGARRVIYTIDVGSAAPVDVPANDLERAASEELNDRLVRFDGPLERNPRDGVATLVAAVRGAEHFTDLNDNGKYDDGEPFDDAAEPFVDVDDDGQFDAALGDRFPAGFDANHNGKWDPPNGVFDASTLIGKSTHVLWTGAPELFVDGKRSIAPHGSEIYAAFMLDPNGNPPAGFDSGDQVTISVQGKPSEVEINGLVLQPLSTEIGMSFGPLGAFQDFTRESDTRYPKLRRFDISVSDKRKNTTSSAAFTFTGSVRYTPGPRAQSIQTKTLPLQPVTITIQSN